VKCSSERSPDFSKRRSPLTHRINSLRCRPWHSDTAAL
jgi:hypothetical protein